VFAQLLVNGLVAGSVYALTAIGYSMIYGVLRFINFAHGDLLTVSGFVAFFALTALRLPPWLAIALALTLTAALGVFAERVAYRPLRRRSRLAPLITAMGMSIVFQSAMLILFGPQVRMPSPGAQPSLRAGSVAFTPVQAATFASSLGLTCALALFLHRTRLGKSVRATADQLELAATLGIDTDRTVSVTFALASALAAVAGVLVALDQGVYPTMGVPLGLKAFIASVLGGIGSIPGALLGGFVIGIVENIAIWRLPAEDKDLAAFAVLAIILFLRPQGLATRTPGRAA
jgi:branched-chain amino acid transport system permease protein